MPSNSSDKNDAPRTSPDGDRPSYPLDLFRADVPQQGKSDDATLAFDKRSSAVFRQWLSSMATDAEAALAAAMSYREMTPSGRDQWLAFLQGDIQGLDIPKIAIFAPLLSVEQDPERRQLLESLAFDDDQPGTSLTGRCALVGQKSNGERVYVLVCPLYLSFAQVLACGVNDGCFVWVRHDPIVAHADAPKRGDLMQDVKLEGAAFVVVLDELAATVLSHQRRGHTLPEAVYMLSDLLGEIGP
jgi:hypothetical protein